MINDTRALIVFAFLIFRTFGDFGVVGLPAAVNIPALLRKTAVSMPSQKGGYPNAAAGAQAEPETLNVVYYVNPKDASIVPLEGAVAQMSASSNSLTGAVTGQMVVRDQKSPVRLKLSQKPEFEFRLVDSSQNFAFRFERFEAKDVKRIFKFVKDPRPSNSPDRPGLLTFDSSHFGKSSIKISIPYDLPPGEYGVTISGRGIGVKVFCFGVDPP